MSGNFSFNTFIKEEFSILQGEQFSPQLNSSIGPKNRSLTVLESVSFEVLSVVLACYLEQHRISRLMHLEDFITLKELSYILLIVSFQVKYTKFFIHYGS